MVRDWDVTIIDQRSKGKPGDRRFQPMGEVTMPASRKILVGAEDRFALVSEEDRVAIVATEDLVS